MFSKLKYILFDFSDTCKNDILSETKRTIVFLIVGLIAFPFIGKSEWLGGIGGLCLCVFGFMWGRALVSSLAGLGSLIKNDMLKWMFIIIFFGVCVLIGFIYFVWCMVKLIVMAVRK
ncbi:MAG: hypothetical protein Q4E21_07920 [Clostridia bacterium]|nr:hypothetical protein [Clostridia bacterium]